MDIISLSDYKKNKIIKQDLVREGRTPLYVSHLTGQISGDKVAPEFGDRLSRIRASLERINRLMREIKQQSAEGARD